MPTVKRDVIATELRRQILTGELAAGARVLQDQLAQEFQVSITPVREALRLLEAEGLLTSEPNRGVSVAGIELEAVRANFLLRRMIDSYAMQHVRLRLAPIDFVRLRAILDAMTKAKDAGDGNSFHEQHREFHFYFYERCGAELAPHVAALWHVLPWGLLFAPDTVGEALAEEYMIIHALEADDTDQLIRTSEHHIEAAYERIAATLIAKGAAHGSLQLDVE